MTNCHKGRSPFDPETASWCNCDVPLRTLRCATCGRFRTQLGTPVTPFDRRPRESSPVLLIVDDKSRRARLETFQFGIDEFIEKPLNFNELATVLGRIAPIVTETHAIRTAV
jgi:hypothetical protein